MPKQTTSSKSKNKKSSRKTVLEPTTFESARTTVTDGIKKHGKAPKTTQNYDSYIRRGIEFLEQFVQEEDEAEGRWKEGNNGNAANLSAEGEDQIASGEQAKMHPQFRNAFTGPPIECTPMAIAMFLAHKCLTNNLSKSTASGIQAAFLQHYDRMEGDKYRGRWNYDRVAKEWVGNPVRSAEVEDIHEACKNKDGEGERRHSRAMSIQDMRSLYAYFQKHCPSSQDVSKDPQAKEIGERGTYLFFNAFSSSAFTVWMRIGEVSTLQYKNLEFPHGRHRQSNGSSNSGTQNNHFFKLNLRNRKNWQKREKNGEHQLNGHTYQIYPQPTTPEIDMYRHLLDWLDFYEESLLGRPLQDDDYLFPTIGSNGTTVQPSRPISPDVAQKKIVHMAEIAGIPGAKYFTTHCFRRGGAQYRFMYSPLGERWILARIRWWGGWATGEHRDTLIRYLLDELYTYEEDHSNALCPTLRQTSESGTTSSATVGMDIIEGFTHEVSSMKSELQEYRALFKNAISTVSTSMTPVSRTQTGFLNPSPMHVVTSNCNILEVPYTTQPSSRGYPTCIPSSPNGVQDQPLIPQVGYPTQLDPSPRPQSLDLVHIVPGLLQGRSANAYEQVVRDWEFADPARSLYVAMKDWKPEWHRARKQTQKYGQRQTVALEFINHFHRDTNSFTAAYPEYRRGFTPLLNAIRREQQKRGDCEERISRRKRQKID